MPVYSAYYAPVAGCSTCGGYGIGYTSVSTYRPLLGGWVTRTVPYTAYRPVYASPVTYAGYTPYYAGYTPYYAGYATYYAGYAPCSSCGSYVSYSPVVAYSPCCGCSTCAACSPCTTCDTCNACATYSPCSACITCSADTSCSACSTGSSCSGCSAQPAYPSPTPTAPPANAAPQRTFSEKPTTDSSSLKPIPEAGTQMNSMPGPVLNDQRDRTTARPVYTAAKVVMTAQTEAASPVRRRRLAAG